MPHRPLPLLLALTVAVLAATVGPRARPGAADAALPAASVTALSPYAVSVAWRDSAAGPAAVSYSLQGETDALWAVDSSRRQSHTIRIDGLLPGRTYVLHLHRGSGAAGVGPTLTVRTPSETSPVSTKVGRGGAILLDGTPFFPVMQWLQCPSTFAENVAMGVDVFLGKGCSSNPDAEEVAQLSRLNAFSVLPYDDAVKGSPGLFGWHFDDEPDGNGEPPSTIAHQYRLNRSRDPNHLNFLTVESNFYSLMSPPPGGDRSIYRSYAAATDVLGFDLYPIYGWCRPDWIARVAGAQQELVQQYAGGRPTYQWIEASSTSSRWCKGRGPTPTEVRAEVWMAVVNGAKAIGYFTHSWTPDYSQFRVSRGVRAEIARTDRELEGLTPVILGRRVAASSSATPIEAIGRSHGGAVYVIAVNTSRSRVSASISVAGGGSGTARVVDENRTLRTAGGRLTDTFAPLAAHVYEIAPAGFAAR
jgi:hypothetical protein